MHPYMWPIDEASVHGKAVCSRRGPTRAPRHAPARARACFHGRAPQRAPARAPDLSPARSHAPQRLPTSALELAAAHATFDATAHVRAQPRPAMRLGVPLTSRSARTRVPNFQGGGGEGSEILGKDRFGHLLG